MKDNILVSVIVFAYNSEKYIEQALLSVLNQNTNFDYEIIVHDDCSVDGTAKIIRQYQEKYHNIIGIYQDSNKYQRGIYIIKEYIYPLIRGKYIAYCDADDYWIDSEKLQKQVDFMENNPEYSLCTHGFRFEYVERNRKKDNHIYSTSCEIELETFIVWNGDYVPQIGTWLFRTDLTVDRPEIFHVIRVENTLSISDQPLAMYLALKGKVWYINEIMSVWRRYTASVSTSMLKTYGVVFNKNKKIFLESVRDFFDSSLSQVFDKAIAICERDIMFYNNNYKDVINNAYFKDYPLRTRGYIWLSVYFPLLADVLKYIKNKLLRR